jgi:hypothetical protein
MKMLKEAFPLAIERSLEDTFLHVDLSGGNEIRLFFNRKYYIVEWAKGSFSLIPSTDDIEAIIEEVRKDYENIKKEYEEKYKTEKDNNPEEKETATWKYDATQESEPVVECLPALECAAPEEVYPKEEEVEYWPIYVKVKEVGGIKFKSLEFNYPADKFCSPEEYNAEEFGTVVVAYIRWKTDVKELVKELNDNGCRSISRELWDGRPPMRLNDEFARYAEMEYNRGYKVTLVLEEPTTEEQAVLSELQKKADKVINKLFGDKK